MKAKKLTEEYLINSPLKFNGRSYIIDIGMFNKLEIMSVGSPYMASIISECPKTKEVKEIMLGFICDYEEQLENLFFALTGKNLI